MALVQCVILIPLLAVVLLGKAEVQDPANYAAEGNMPTNLDKVHARSALSENLVKLSVPIFLPPVSTAALENIPTNMEDPLMPSAKCVCKESIAT